MSTPQISFCLIACLSGSCFAAIVDDIGPNTANGTVNTYGRSDTGGQPICLGGDLSTPYVVSGNAGVWKCARGEFEYGPWVQLSDSPAHAYCLAVDPNNPSHVAVGERDGDAIDVQQNSSGVWESYDAGATWTRILDPLTRPGGCTSQAIPAIAFTPNSALVAGTVCGIAIRHAGGGNFTFPSLPLGIDSTWIRAVAASRNKVWARTGTRLIVSTDDGANWSLIKPVPASFGVTADRGDDFSLAAFDFAAYFSAHKDFPSPPGGNCALLKYDVPTDNWSIENVALGSGTGLGGRKFVKAFDLARPDLPDTIGQRLQLVYCAAQDVVRAAGLNTDGTIQWTRVVTTRESGSSPQDPVHSDIWDFHLAPDASKAWLANDGGVYSQDWPSGSWGTQNQNLFTHYIYTLTVLQTASVFNQCIGYAPPDNDGWYFEPGIGWKSEGSLGDVNWTAGDLANSNIVLLVRVPQSASLVGFNNPLPNGQKVEYVDLNNATPYDGTLSLQFIQTLQNEPANPLGDVVMLVNLPLQYRNSSGNLVNVPGSLGQPNPSGAPVLIRNSQFAANPDANVSQFQTWAIVANDLPTGTRGFWVSGGHVNPVYYACTPSTLYKRNSNGNGWTPLSVTGLLPRGTYGPAFVNPYSPDVLYVLTSSGIKFSRDGGTTFQDDATLTSLLTASGKFPLTDNFRGGNGSYVVFGSHGIAMGTLSHMAFDRSQPARMVAASPFTGVFYNDGSGTWRDLTGLLPKPLASVSTVGISGQSILVGTQGRGLLRIFLDDAEYCFINAPVLNVPAQYGTVHAAYNAALDCNIIRINTGTYHETMPFTLRKHLRLESQGGPAIIRQ